MNSFEKKAIRASRILGCYSNAADCINKAEEAKSIPVITNQVRSVQNSPQPVGTNIGAAYRLFGSAIESLRTPMNKADASFELVKSAFDKGLITDDEFLGILEKRSRLLKLADKDI